MSKTRYILAIDQGTSSTKSLIFDEAGQVVAKSYEPLQTYYVEHGFVEQDPEGIYENVLLSAKKCIDTFTGNGGKIADIGACGISNQRETFVVWNEDGKALHNAVVWQCKRSISICERLKREGVEQQVKSKTGLIIDPYFSGTKLMWLNENSDKIRNQISNGKAYFGTIDTWLLYKLTGGKSYLTDYTNASRTLFFNLEKLVWDKELLQSFGLSKINLPEAKPSSYFFGETTFNGLSGIAIPITGMIGDSHAASFGEGCFSTGTAKATLGTGSSILMNIGNKIADSKNGMMTTICWATENRVDYAFEGVIVSCGSTIEWLKNELGLIDDSKVTEGMAVSVRDNNGVYLVPAFSGLGAPHWDMGRKASITGLTFDCNKNHIIRAALESIAYQIKDVIVVMERDAGIALQELTVDGGIASNKFVLQFLSDLLGKKIVRIGTTDVSALGAAYIAGLKDGLYDFETLKSLNNDKSFFHPTEDRTKFDIWYKGWREAIGCLKSN